MWETNEWSEVLRHLQEKTCAVLQEQEGDDENEVDPSFIKWVLAIKKN